MDFHTGDDAAVYQLSPEQALVFTVDFFPPVVDDPYDFGQVAAANALSDIYAMGGTPLLALNLASFPTRALGVEAMRAILKGGLDKVLEAGAWLGGGHTIEDDQPKYGLAVVGLAHPQHLLTNREAQPGDLLYLTKPLGSGILTAALRKKVLSPKTCEQITQIMATLNQKASRLLVSVGAKAATDITGYGLLGHLLQMTKASGVSARIQAKEVPVLEEVWTFVRKRNLIPRGTRANYQFVNPETQWGPSVDELTRLVLCDAQTSGGLLGCVPPQKEQAFLEGARVAGLEKTVFKIGVVLEKQPSATLFVST